METLHLDTHVAVWLYAGEGARFPVRVREFIEKSDLVISPMVLVEIQFLREAGKVNIKPERFLRDMYHDFNFRLSDILFSDMALSSVELSWTRDPFDRMIVASAMADEARLITRDRVILKNYKKAVWD